jgi:uncharacterized protein involved in exopolysaccharide biosynthesis
MALAVGLLLGCASALAAVFLLPARYTAYAILQVAPTGSMHPWEYQSTGKSMLVNPEAFIKSRPVFRAALTKQPALRELSLLRDQEDPLEWLEKEIKADTLENTYILRISLTGKNAKELPILVNAIKDAYLEHVANPKLRMIVLQDTEEPKRRDFKSQIPLMVFAGAGALLLGVFGVSYWESCARRIHRGVQMAADLERGKKRR